MSPRNEHHGLPRSHGGSRHQNNITIVDEDRHNQWHGIVGHPTPDGLLRHLLLVHATKIRPVLPVSVVRDGLEVLSPVNVLYETNVESKLLQTIDGQRNAVRHRIHRWMELMSERQLTAQVMAAFTIGTELPRDVPDVSDALHGFFQVEGPSAKLHGILTEADGGDLAWSKPLRAAVRSNVLTLLRGVQVEPQTPNEQRRMLEVVDAHLNVLERTTSRRPSIDELLDYQAWRQTIIGKRTEAREKCA